MNFEMLLKKRSLTTAIIADENALSVIIIILNQKAQER